MRADQLLRNVLTHLARLPGMPPAMRGPELGGGYPAPDEPGGDLPDPLVGVLGVAAEQAEGLLGRHPELSVQDALGLLDHGPGLQPRVQALDHPPTGPVQRPGRTPASGIRPPCRPPAVARCAAGSRRRVRLRYRPEDGKVPRAADPRPRTSARRWPWRSSLPPRCRPAPVRPLARSAGAAPRPGLRLPRAAERHRRLDQRIPASWRS